MIVPKRFAPYHRANVYSVFPKQREQGVGDFFQAVRGYVVFGNQYQEIKVRIRPRIPPSLRAIKYDLGLRDDLLEHLANYFKFFWPSHNQKNLVEKSLSVLLIPLRCQFGILDITKARGIFGI